MYESPGKRRRVRTNEDDGRTMTCTHSRFQSIVKRRFTMPNTEKRSVEQWYIRVMPGYESPLKLRVFVAGVNIPRPRFAFVFLALLPVPLDRTKWPKCEIIFPPSFEPLTRFLLA